MLNVQNLTPIALIDVIDKVCRINSTSKINIEKWFGKEEMTSLRIDSKHQDELDITPLILKKVRS